MSWEVVEQDIGEGKDDDGRRWLTDGNESFLLDGPSAERIRDLLNAKPSKEAAKK